VDGLHDAADPRADRDKAIRREILHIAVQEFNPRKSQFFIALLD